jgi:hypothetical protein
MFAHRRDIWAGWFTAATFSLCTRCNRMLFEAGVAWQSPADAPAASTLMRLAFVWQNPALLRHNEFSILHLYNDH